MEKLVRIAVMAWSEMRWAERFAPRMTLATACVVFAFIAALGALLCVIAGFWMYINLLVGPVAASLWSALLMAVLSAILVFVARSVFAGDDAPPRHRAPQGLPGIPLSDEAILEIRNGIGQNKTAALISALVAGVALGGLDRR